MANASGLRMLKYKDEAVQGGALMERGRRSLMLAALPLLLLLLLLLALGGGAAADDTSSLLAFKAAVDAGNQLKAWNRNVSVCNWTGIKCSDKGRVRELRMPGSGLRGPIPDGTIGNLDELRILSLRQNRLSGPFPADLLKLHELRSLYLQNNNLSGPLPLNVSSAWPKLVRVSVAYNAFTGSLPAASLNNLSRLATLYVQNNSLSGDLEALSLPKLKQFSAANNQLNGSVPAALRVFGVAAFSGNRICGPPLAQACPAPPPVAAPPLPANSPPADNSNHGNGGKKKKKLSKGAVAGIVVAGVVAAAALLCCLLLLCRRGRGGGADKEAAAANAARSVDKDDKAAAAVAAEELPRGGGGGGAEERNKLVFFSGAPYSFELEDLLRASAEVLGKGSVGTAYKAVLEDGAVVAVKRLKDVPASARDFEQHIHAIGKLQHPNLVPLRAYYFSKDEKLLVYDYMPLGSLSALLHGSRGAGRTPLDWVSRVRIAQGAARGIAYLHDQQGGFVHGNIKSSNVLLKKTYEAAVSDFGLSQLFGGGGGGGGSGGGAAGSAAAAAASRMVGYRAPEVAETRRATQRSDVYSFGVLLLELLTGKPPTQASLNEEGIDLPRWVQSVVREEWTAEVFDLELMRYANIEEEMVQLLQVAMSCVAASPDQRPRMREVVKMIDDVHNSSSSGGGSGGHNTDGTSDSRPSQDRSNGHTPPYAAPAAAAAAAAGHSPDETPKQQQQQQQLQDLQLL